MLNGMDAVSGSKCVAFSDLICFGNGKEGNGTGE